MIYMTVPKSHPRYESLRKRERIIQGMKAGIVAEAGPIAHGRGEAFDYLLGEKTHKEADLAEKIATYYLFLAEHPVISVNGNTAVLVPDDLVNLSSLLNAPLEINLFYRTSERVSKIAELLKKHGANDILGEEPDAEIPNLEHKRALCSQMGTMKADVILVPLEDGDRALALKNMGKTVIAIDLNPMSRTSLTSDVSIVDDVVRAIANIVNHVKIITEKVIPKEEMTRQISEFNNKRNLQDILEIMKKRAISQD
jgi:4-phosphopantoate--beta-alanine ligase